MLWRWIYSSLLLASWPLVSLYFLYQRCWRGRYSQQLLQRLGWGRLPPPGPPCLWFHAVSVGETCAVAPLIEKQLLAQPSARIVLSHITQTGLEQGRRLFGDRIEHLLLPPDWPWTMRALVRRLQPRMLVLVESDCWPNLVWYAKTSGARLVMVNARLSPDSLRWYRRLQPLMGSFWKLFDRIAAQSSSYARAFEQLGAQGVADCGNMKLARSLEPDPDRLKRMQQLLGGSDLVIVVACTHPGEEELALELGSQLKRDLPQLRIRWVLAPRHPERFDQLFERLSRCGEPCSRWSTAHQPSVWLLLDAIGCLNEAYRCAQLALVGGSWCKGVGGHNFLEPVMAAVPTFYGPHVFKQTDFHRLAQQQQLAFCVGQEELATKIVEWLQDPDRHRAWLKRQRLFQSNSQESVQRTFDWIWSEAQEGAPLA